MSAFEEDLLSKDGLIYGAGAFTKRDRSYARTQIHQYKAIISDMDGVVHRFGTVIPAAPDFFKHLQDRDIPFLLLTNECRWTNEALAAKLSNLLGMPFRDADIYSAANAARDFFIRALLRGDTASTYVVGEAGLLSNIREAYAQALDPSAAVAGASNPIHAAEQDSADRRPSVLTSQDEFQPERMTQVGWVVIGSLFAEDTRAVEIAARHLRDGARLLYTCPDWYDVAADGSMKFGMPKPSVKLLQKAMGIEGYNLGKPNPFMVRSALGKILRKDPSLRSSDVMFIGDSLRTDIRTAIENGIDCTLVLSGTTTLTHVKSSPLLPNFILPSIKEFYQLFSQTSNQ